MKRFLVCCLSLVFLTLAIPRLAQSAAPPHAIIAVDRTPGYGIPGAPHTVLAYIAKGEQVEVRGRSRDRKWLQVTFQSIPLWIASDAATLSKPITRIPILRMPTLPKPPAPTDCTDVPEAGFAEGGLPDVLMGLRDGSCVRLTTKSGEKQLWLWHPAGSTLTVRAFSPVVLRYGPWGLRMQNFYGELMHVNWNTDKQGRPTYAGGAPIFRRNDVLYYDLTPLMQVQKRGKLLLLNDVHLLERIQ